MLTVNNHNDQTEMMELGSQKFIEKVDNLFKIWGTFFIFRGILQRYKRGDNAYFDNSSINHSILL